MHTLENPGAPGHPQVPNPHSQHTDTPTSDTTFRSDQPTLSNNPSVPNAGQPHRTTTHSHPPTNVPTLSNNPWLPQTNVAATATHVPNHLPNQKS